ncbi:MAG TPA: hypothetical protein VFI24_00960 [Pyrinomonadaceae bacterium]|nr:hypothetical protein [Pyrinomonadaceae bacterium]
MISNRLLLCIVLLVFLQPTSSAEHVQKSSDEPINDPSVIVIGGVSETFDLVLPDKLTVNARPLPNGNEIAELPKLSEYYAGTIYHVRISEIIKGNKIVRSGQIITVLIPGPPNVSHRVILSAQRKYLLQLASLADAERYKGMVVMELGNPSSAKEPFDSHNVFAPVKDINNAVPVTEDNKDLIKRIRREAKR